MPGAGGAARDTFSGEESCGHIPTSGHEFSLVRRARRSRLKAQQPTAPFETETTATVVPCPMSKSC